jgi:hypothetical protein
MPAAHVAQPGPGGRDGGPDAAARGDASAWSSLAPGRAAPRADPASAAPGPGVTYAPNPATSELPPGPSAPTTVSGAATCR